MFSLFVIVMASAPTAMTLSNGMSLTPRYQSSSSIVMAATAPFLASMSRVLLRPSSRPSVMLITGSPKISALVFIAISPCV